MSVEPLNIRAGLSGSPDQRLFEALVEHAPEGVVLSDRDGKVIYANAAMERLTGYNRAQICGRNLRFLRAEDHEQEGVAKIRDAVRDGNGCRTVLRNYRQDGTMFWNEVSIVPLHDSNGGLTHFASFHRDVTEKLRAEPRAESRAEARDPSMSTQTMLAYLRDDKLTGLLRRPYFEELVKRDWALAQREARRLSFVVFDLDCFALYRDVFGRQGAEQAFRRIARVIGGCFRRASDLCGRFDEDQVATLMTGMDLEQASKLADAVLGRVRDLAVHHPRSIVSRYVTASAGVVSLVPSHDLTIERVYEAALNALKDAKELGRNRVVSRECE